MINSKDRDSGSSRDRRVRKTKAVIRRVFIDLLSKKSLHTITVNELVTVADINRGTFYLHYRDLQDLLCHIEDEMLMELNAILVKFEKTSICGDNYSFFMEILEFIHANSDVYQLLLNEQCGIPLLEKMKIHVEINLSQHIRQQYPLCNPTFYDLYVTFVVSGSLGVLLQWVRNRCTEPPEVLAGALDQIVRCGLGFLTGKSV